MGWIIGGVIALAVLLLNKKATPIGASLTNVAKTPVFVTGPEVGGPLGGGAPKCCGGQPQPPSINAIGIHVPVSPANPMQPVSNIKFLRPTSPIMSAGQKKYTLQ